MAAYLRNSTYNPNLQIWAMRKLYPQFKARHINEGEIEFTGTLQVKPELPVYRVSLTYRGSKQPHVKIIEPELVDKPPHFYPATKTLCLYNPDDFHWRKEKLIAHEIISWTAAWIYFYEVWLQTGKWFGPEASHNVEKTQL